MWMARRQSVRSSEWSWKRRGTDELWSHQKQTIYSDTKIIYAKEQRSWPRFCSGVLGRVIYLADGWRDLISRRSPRGAHSCGRWRSAGKKIKMQFNKNILKNELNVRKTWQDSCDVIILWGEASIRLSSAPCHQLGSWLRQSVLHHDERHNIFHRTMSRTNHFDTSIETEEETKNLIPIWTSVTLSTLIGVPPDQQSEF